MIYINLITIISIYNITIRNFFTGAENIIYSNTNQNSIYQITIKQSEFNSN